MVKETQKVRFNPQDVIDAQVESINEAIAEIDKRMKPYEALAAKKQQLIAARRALLGTGSRLTNNGGSRVTLDDIIQFLQTNPGSSPGQIAENFGVTQGTVSSHLYRNNGRFVRKDGLYFARSTDAPEEETKDEDD